MASKTAFDDHLLPGIGLGELEKEDAGGEVVDVGKTECAKGVGQLVGYDFDIEGGEALFHFECED